MAWVTYGYIVYLLSDPKIDWRRSVISAGASKIVSGSPHPAESNTYAV